MACTRSSTDLTHPSLESEATTAMYDPNELGEGATFAPLVMHSQTPTAYDPINHIVVDHDGVTWGEREIDRLSGFQTGDSELDEAYQSHPRTQDLRGPELSGNLVSRDLESYAQSIPRWHSLSPEDQHWFLQLVTARADENDWPEAFQRELLLFCLAGLSHDLHYTSDGYPEDRITIECADNTNITCQPHHTEAPTMVCLVMVRSQLMHSGWFVNWFNSPHYLARAEMKITWPRDPIACWEMAKSYMEDGYDRFGNNQITTYVCSNFLLNDRFIVLVRLYKLARVLDLFGLMDGAFTVLVEMEHLVSPPNVLTLARYIFGGEEYCENITNLRKWCLKLIGKHYDWLLNSDQWAKVVESSAPELGEQWMRITALKKMVSQEELRKAIQQNVSDANAIIKALKAVDTKSATPTEADSSIEAEFSRCPVTSKKEYTFTGFERIGPGTPTKKQAKSKDSLGFLNKQLTFSFDDSDSSDRDLKRNGEKRPLAHRNSSFHEVSEADEGDTGNANSDSTGKHRASIPRTPSFQEVFGDDIKPATAFQFNNEAHGETVFGRRDILTGPVTGVLTYSISEPLLSSRRPARRYKDTNGSTINELEDSDQPLLSAKDNNHNDTNQRENIYHPAQRGVILTPDALRELDRWPLSDIPLPDPLLPIPLARHAPYFDLEGDKHQQFNATIHQAQAVTVFGLHRPGMGGSVVVPASEKTVQGESRAGAANGTKAREFLGINEPCAVATAGMGARPSLDVEPKKLKKKAMWMG